jgi:hypothetical protein
MRAFLVSCLCVAAVLLAGCNTPPTSLSAMWPFGSVTWVDPKAPATPATPAAPASKSAANKVGQPATKAEVAKLRAELKALKDERDKAAIEAGGK